VYDRKAALPRLLENLRDIEKDPSLTCIKIRNIIQDHQLDFFEIVVIYKAALSLQTPNHNDDDDDNIKKSLDLLYRLFKFQNVPQSIRVHCVNLIISVPKDKRVPDWVKVLNAATNGGTTTAGVSHRSLLLSTCAFAKYCAEQSEKDSGIHTVRNCFSLCINLICQIIENAINLDCVMDLELIEDISELAKYTDRSSEALNLVETFDTLTARGEIPSTCVRSMLQALCLIEANAANRKDGQVVERSQELLKTMLQSQYQNVVSDGLVSIFNTNRYIGKCEISAKGAIELLISTLVDQRSNKDADIYVGAIVHTLQTEDSDLQVGLLSSIVTFVSTYITQFKIQSRWVADIEWDGFLTTLMTTYAKAIEKGENVKSLDEAMQKLIVISNEGLTSRQRNHLTRVCLKTGQYLPSNILLNLLKDYEKPLTAIDQFNELQLLLQLIENDKVSSTLRSIAVDIIKALHTAILQTDSDLSRQNITLICTIISTIYLESSNQSTLVDIVVDYITAKEINDDDLFESVVQYFTKGIQLYATEIKPSSFISTGKAIASGMVVLFMRNINFSASRCQRLIEVFLERLNSPNIDPATGVMLLRLLFRLRSDVRNRIFIIPSPEGEGLAANLSRTVLDDEELSSSASSESGAVWRYGQFQGLPEDPPAAVSPVLYSKRYDSKDDDRSTLNLVPWLKYVISAIEKGADWEIYSYIIVHLGAQLTNHSLFGNGVECLKQLQQLICTQLRRRNALRPPECTKLKQSDVAVCLYHIVTVLIGYHDYFDRQGSEDMVSAFIVGLTAWDRTTIPCIHALTLCCYELPQSLQRDLIRVILQMATIVNKSVAADHVLEFLAGLSRIPYFIRTFHGEEIKTVFGVCFSYIDYVRSKRYNDGQQMKTKSTTSSVMKSLFPQSPAGHAASETAPEYVFALAYHVVTQWYNTLHQEDMIKYLPWIRQRLLTKDSNGNFEEHAINTIDAMWRLGRRPRHKTTLTGPVPLEVDSVAYINQYSLLSITIDRQKNLARLTDRRPSGTDNWTVPIKEGTTPSQVIKDSVLKPDEEPFPDILPFTKFQTNSEAIKSVTFFDKISPIDFYKAGVIYAGEDQYTETPILANTMGSEAYRNMVQCLGSRLDLKGLQHNVCGLDTSPNSNDGDHTIWYRDEVTALIYHIATYMPTDMVVDPACLNKKQHIGNDFVTIAYNNTGENFNFNTLPSAFNFVYIVVTPESKTTFLETRTGVDQLSSSSLPPTFLSQPRSYGIPLTSRPSNTYPMSPSFRRSDSPSSSSSSTDDSDDDLSGHNRPSRNREDISFWINLYPELSHIPPWFANSWFKVKIMLREGIPDVGSATDTKVVSGRALGMYLRNLVLNACFFTGVWASRSFGAEYGGGSWRVRLQQIRKMKGKYEDEKVGLEKGIKDEEIQLNIQEAERKTNVNNSNNVNSTTNTMGRMESVRVGKKK